MAKTVTMRITFIRAAVLAASAVVALMASCRCNASCGEYVYSRYRTMTHQVSDVRRHDLRNDHEVLKSERVRPSEDNGVPHETFPVQPLPCNGPDCSQNPTPALPFVPPATVAGGHQDRLIVGQLTVELPSDVSHRRDIKDVARALRGFPLLIEMPPELVG